MASAATQPDEVFNAARRLTDPAARRAYLDEACADDADLRRQVEALVGAFEQAGSFLQSPAAGIGPGATTDQPTALPSHVGERSGAAVGPYKLLEQIGEGGFGMVFMAEQTHPVRRKVALKVLKPGMDTRQVIARFEAERQALAIMDHPNIAKVLDGGATASGRPYFVMELVRGVPITEFCDQNHYTPRQRLELFVSICQAVQHAHHKGIIHRDLKPSNVLVSVHDTTPVVKVIDFGVAKAMGQELTDKTLFTNFAQMIGTPLYMSPEQAGQSGLDVDTRSDIYSLGVLLYELLTGTTPFDGGRFKQAAYEEIRRIIREEEPPRPSMRLSDLGRSGEPSGMSASAQRSSHARLAGSTTSLASVSALRHLEPAKLTKLVRGELDWIVMKALEKDRNRRYETANGLAMDLRRYLANEPVQACPPSARYRLRKFTSRYRVPLAVAAGFLLLLVASTVVSTWQAIQIRAEQQNTLAQKLEADQQRSRAKKERAAAVTAEQKALSEARKSEQVAAFMTDMLKGVRPSVALGRDTTMLREILETTTKRLDQLKGQPAVEAELRTVIGGVYLDLADFQNSESMFRSALALRRRTLGDKHPDVASSLSDLAEALRKQNKFAESKQLFAEALAMQRELLGSNSPAVGLTLSRLGMMHNRRGNGAEAEPLIREALAIYRQHPGHGLDDPHGQLAVSLSLQRKFTEAELVASEYVDLCRKRAPSGDPALALALYNLGETFRAQKLHAKAEPCIREALQIQRDQLPPGHDSMLWSINSLIWILVATDRMDEAKPLIDEFVRLAGDRYLYRPACAGIATTLHHYGLVASTRGMHREADQHLRKALDLRLRLFGETHLGVEETRITLAESLLKQEKLGEAEPFVLQALASTQRRSVDGGAIRPSPLVMLGKIQQSRRQFADAEKSFLEAVNIVERDPTQPNSEKRMAFLQLAAFYDATERPEQAERTRAKLTAPNPATRAASRPAD